MTHDEYGKLPPKEKEHFYRSLKCGQFVDKRELRDVIFHESDHNRQMLALPRIIGKPIRKRRLDRAKDRFGLPDGK
jgi:hypothetical protein